MKLWKLSRLFSTGWGQHFGFVIAAESEIIAREAAAKEANYADPEDRSMWLEREMSSCSLLAEDAAVREGDGDPTSMSEQFNSCAIPGTVIVLSSLKHSYHSRPTMNGGPGATTPNRLICHPEPCEGSLSAVVPRPPHRESNRSGIVGRWAVTASTYPSPPRHSRVIVTTGSPGPFLSRSREASGSGSFVGRLGNPWGGAVERPCSPGYPRK